MLACCTLNTGDWVRIPEDFLEQVDFTLNDDGDVYREDVPSDGEEEDK